MSNVAYINEVPPEQQAYADQSQLKTFYDAKNKIGWFLMKGAPRPSFTLRLLDDISDYLENVKHEMQESNGEKYDYLVVGSDVDGMFNLGGDLELFKKYIEAGDRQGLLDYAVKCIDILYQNMFHYNLDLTTISRSDDHLIDSGRRTRRWFRSGAVQQCHHRRKRYQNGIAGSAF